MDFVISCLRTLFFSLDRIIFGFIDDVYSLLMQIARTRIFDEATLHSFSQRIYVLLGLFMLFKVMVSIVNYVLNPDELMDKEKGFTTIIKKIILSLVMIVLVPYVFREAYSLQSIILRENTIMTIVFGSPGEDFRKETGSNTANSSFYDTAGQKIQFTILYTFARPNIEEFTGDANYDLSDCVDTYKIDDTTNNFVFRDKSGSTNGEKSGYIYELNEKCFGKYNPEKDLYESDGSETGHLLSLFDNIEEKGIYQNYAQGVAQQSMGLFFRKNIMLAKTDDGRYIIDYKWGLSTAVGVATLYLLLLFCIDIAGRSIKLSFLQLISPIPIISYCDPKSGKDGMFKKWYTMCFKTYAELFIRLFALFFGIYIISLVGTFTDIETGIAVDNWLVRIFMIIGVLIFVKKLPDIIKDALGVDLGGKLELNPLKKLENEALGGKLISGAGKKAVGVAGGVAAGTLGAVAGAATLQGIHRKNFTSAIASGWKGDKFGKMFSSSYGAGRERHKQLQEMASDGVNRRQVLGDKVFNAFHGQSRAAQDKGWSSKMESVTKAWDSVRGTIAAVDSDAKRLKNIEDGIKQGGTGAFKDKRVWDSSTGAYKTVTAAEQYADALENATKDLDKRVQDIVNNHSLMNDGAGGKAGGDAAIANITNTIKTMDTLINQINSQNIKYVDASGTERTVHLNDSSVKGVKAASKGALGEKNAWESSSTYTTQQDIEKYSGGKKS